MIDPMFTISTKYRSHAIKEPFRHLGGIQKTTVSTITAETRVRIECM